MTRQNPAIAAMHRRWAELEEEYGMPIRELILSFRADGLQWKTIAGIFEIDKDTITRWRKRLGLPITPLERRWYPGECEKRQHADRLARAAGWPSMQEAVRDLRMSGWAQWQIAKRFGISRNTVKQHTPPELVGMVHNITPEGMATFRELGKRNGSLRASPNHPWRQDNANIFRVRECPRD